MIPITSIACFAQLCLTLSDPLSTQRQQMLSREVTTFLNEPDFPTLVRTLREWPEMPQDDRLLLIDLLAKQLLSNEKPGIKNPNDLIVPYRLQTRDLKPYGHGYATVQDIFIVGGKAAWAIGQLMGGVQLPEINEGQTKEQRAKQAASINRSIALYKEVIAYLGETNYPTLHKTVKGWKSLPLEDRIRVLDLVAAHLLRTEKPGLTNAFGQVIIPYRRDIGEMKQGRGEMVLQDLFIIGGKAAWVIATLTDLGYELPQMNGGLTGEERGERARAIQQYIRAYKHGVRDASAHHAEKK